MKKISLTLGLAMFFVFSSCEKKVEKTVETTETTIVNDTVTVEKEATAEPPKEDGTSVEISNDGVKVDSKDVDVDVEVRK